MSSTTSRDCLPGRKCRNGSTSSSGCGGIDDAQEVNAAAPSGTIHRLRPASASLSAALCAATWRPSVPACSIVPRASWTRGISERARPSPKTTPNAYCESENSQRDGDTSRTWHPQHARNGGNLSDRAGRARCTEEQLSSRIRLHWPPNAASQLPYSRRVHDKNNGSPPSLCRQSWPGSCHTRRAIRVRD